MPLATSLAVRVGWVCIFISFQASKPNLVILSLHGYVNSVRFIWDWGNSYKAGASLFTGSEKFYTNVSGCGS